MPERDGRDGAVDLRGRRILFVVTEDWYFCSHRLPVARAARDAGAEVIVATRVGGHRDAIEAEGFRAVHLPWRRSSRNMVDEARAFIALVKMYRRERPDLVHHVAVKPTFYGGIAAWCARFGGRAAPRQVHALAGLGYVSTSKQARARLLRPAVRFVFRRLLDRAGSRVIVQNPDDRDALVTGGLFNRSRVTMIRGSGVDTERFRPTPEPEGRVRAGLFARMLRPKGIVEAARAGRRLRERGAGVTVELFGDPDPENPESVPRETLESWAKAGDVVWHGSVSDVSVALAGCHIAILPSYREGLPKSLLEAASCARPIVATDVPGCREIVHDGENGLLVPARNPVALADAIAALAADGELRRRMGERGREMVLERFAEEIVTRETLTLYREVLSA